MSNESLDLKDWQGAIGPQSESNPSFYFFVSEGKRIHLQSPRSIQHYHYSEEQFIRKVEIGEWVLANLEEQSTEEKQPSRYRRL